MIHADQLKETLSRTTEVTQVKPGQGLAGIFQAMNLMEEHMLALGLCPTCLSGFAEVTGMGPDFVLGVVVGRDAKHAGTDTEPRIWVDAERTILVTRELDGTTTVALRPEPGHTWGPPVVVVRES